MVLIAELLFLLVVTSLGARWYLRTSMHRARKNSGVQPPQVAGSMGFGMSPPNNPPQLPQGLHDHRKVSSDRRPLPYMPRDDRKVSRDYQQPDWDLIPKRNT